MSKLTCFDVADYFLSKTDEEAGDVISNLKLQKLVYYAQGFSLAINDKPIFPEPITAWQHGPVCVPLYYKYKENGALGIKAPKNIDFKKFDEDDIDLLDEVYDVYGQFSAWKLRNMIYEEGPWKETKINDIISLEKMKSYFKGLVHNVG